MTRQKTTNFSDHVELGDIIQPFLGKDLWGESFIPSNSGPIVPPGDPATKYVVEWTALEMPNWRLVVREENYADTWHVNARRLKPDGSYNPNGQTISFYQSGAFGDIITQIPVVGKMRQTFVRER